jgi:hypothetical protein
MDATFDITDALKEIGQTSAADVTVVFEATTGRSSLRPELLAAPRVNPKAQLAVDEISIRVAPRR